MMRRRLFALAATLLGSCQPGETLPSGVAQAVHRDKRVERSELHTTRSVKADVPPIWVGLAPGPYAVGYRAELLYDETRPEGPKNRPRPVLRAVWYPAKGGSGTPMRLGDYAKQMGDTDAAIVRRLAQHVAGAIVEDVFELPDRPGRAALLFDPSREEELDRLLALPIAARRGAAPVGHETFPVAIYHPGSASPFEENFVAFEYLASHGVAVVSSAYQPDDRPDPSTSWTTFHVSFGDIQFLRASLVDLPFVDRASVVLMGHSMGAQTHFAYGMAYPGVSAIVSLDTTFEVVPPSERDPATNEIVFGQRERIAAPVLAFTTDRGRDRRFLESIVHSERFLVTLEGLDHEDMQAHGGVLRRRFGPHRRELQSERYAEMCRRVRLFIDYALRSDKGSRAELLESKEGVSVETWGSQASSIRTPGMVIAALDAGNRHLIREACAKEPRKCDDVVSSAAAGLTLDGRKEASRTLLREAMSVASKPWRMHLEAAFNALADGHREAAVTHLRRSLEIYREKKVWGDAYERFLVGQLDRVRRGLE